MIEEKMLYHYGAELILYKKESLIFKECQTPLFYFQVRTGNIKLNNYKEDGKEFIQNILSDGQSFGESLLCNDMCYPMNAIATEDSYVLQLPKCRFMELLSDHPEVSIRLNKILSQRLYFKYVMLVNLSCSDPKTRLLCLMDYLKSFQLDREKFSFKIPLTRQEMANLTGLCVETVIRNVKKLARNKELLIVDRKIYY